MKKITAISLVILMLAAIVHISVAVHYCGGKEFASRLSLNALPASCGMESSQKDAPLQGGIFSSNCCKDVVTIFGTDNNYMPSFSYNPQFYQSDLSIAGLPPSFIVNTPSVLISQFANIRPPGERLANNVDRSDICVFRI